MPIRITVEPARRLDEVVARADLNPSEVRRLGVPDSTEGTVSVVLVHDGRFEETLGRIDFEPTSVRVLNVGTSPDTIFILESPAKMEQEVYQTPSTNDDSDGVSANWDDTMEEESYVAPVSRASGDGEFLKALPLSLTELGGGILSEVRRNFPGELAYYRDSGRFVETPDNFWTVKIQPRTTPPSLRITVRGNPNEFAVSGPIQVKQDRPSHSSIKVWEKNQLRSVLAVILGARKRGDRRR